MERAQTVSYSKSELQKKTVTGFKYRKFTADWKIESL